jgi:PII-like signaling protein
VSDAAVTDAVVTDATVTASTMAGQYVHAWILYGTLGCHLCEQAQAIIQELQQDFPIVVTYVDIAEKVELVALMGERIPVLENPQLQQMLDWPFDPEALTRWLCES